MMVWRFFNLQGAIGAAVSLALGVLLLIQKGETRHWRKQAGQYERLWAGETAAHRQTVANVRAAAAERAEADVRNIARVRADQRAISERTLHDYQSRLADARAAAGRVRQRASATDPGSPGVAAMPGAADAAGGADHSTAQDGFSLADRLIATEQAIQLQALIDWVNAQARIDNDGASSEKPASR